MPSGGLRRGHINLCLRGPAPSLAPSRSFASPRARFGRHARVGPAVPVVRASRVLCLPGLALGNVPEPPAVVSLRLQRTTSSVPQETTTSPSRPRQARRARGASFRGTFWSVGALAGELTEFASRSSRSWTGTLRQQTRWPRRARLTSTRSTIHRARPCWPPTSTRTRTRWCDSRWRWIRDTMRRPSRPSFAAVCRRWLLYVRARSGHASHLADCLLARTSLTPSLASSRRVPRQRASARLRLPSPLIDNGSPPLVLVYVFFCLRVVGLALLSSCSVVFLLSRVVLLLAAAHSLVHNPTLV
jgi:hypothetical protein